MDETCLEGAVVSCVSANDVQLARLADAIAQRVGQQRFHVWFNNSTRLDSGRTGWRSPSPTISSASGSARISPARSRKRPTRCWAARCRCGSAWCRSCLRPNAAQADGKHASRPRSGRDAGKARRSRTAAPTVSRAELHRQPVGAHRAARPAPSGNRAAKRNGVHLQHPAPAAPRSGNFIVGPSNQLAYNTASYVAEFPGSQYNPLFIHGECGLGKTHLLQGLCRKFIEHHPTKRWLYLTGEEFTNEFLSALRNNKLDAFRRKMRDLDLLVIDDVHFLGGKKATQEEFLHTFNAIEAMGKQVVMASDNHPKLIEEFGESLVNRFVSGMVVRIDPPNYHDALRDPSLAVRPAGAGA